MKVQPLNHHIVIKEIKQEEKTESGIILTNPVIGDVRKGTVLACSRNNTTVQPGESILYPASKAKRVDEDKLIIKEDEILGLIQE